MRNVLSLMVVIGSFALVACAHAATPTLRAAPTPALPVQLRVVPAKLRPGMRALMVGSGFERGEPVAFYLIRPDGSATPAGQSTADPQGGAAYELDVLDDWQPGQYVARVQSRKNPRRHAEQKVELLLR